MDLGKHQVMMCASGYVWLKLALSVWLLYNQGNNPPAQVSSVSAIRDVSKIKQFLGLRQYLRGEHDTVRY
jgi:hypothetical protein